MSYASSVCWAGLCFCVGVGWCGVECSALMLNLPGNVENGHSVGAETNYWHLVINGDMGENVKVE